MRYVALRKGVRHAKAYGFRVTMALDKKMTGGLRTDHLERWL